MDPNQQPPSSQSKPVTPQQPMQPGQPVMQILGANTRLEAEVYAPTRAIGFAMGGRPRVLGLSRKTMERAARIDGAIRRGKARITQDRAAYFSHPDWVVSHGARPPHDLWQPRIETREGLKQTARWYRENRWV